MSQTQNYSAQKLTVDSIDVIRLNDKHNAVQVSVVPSLGNNAYEMTVHGTPVLWSPYKSVGEFKATPTFLGIPFLAPWANRLDGEAYYANGKKYLLNPQLDNFRYDSFQQPIHGLLAYAREWEVVDLGADGNSAWVTSRLEFFRNPEWMAQFPFSHRIEMTYRVSDGTLTVHVAIENMSDEPMPLSVGFHPYFAIPDRDAWTLHLPVREHVLLSDKLEPTGDRKAMDLPDPLPLAGHYLDDVFTALVRNGNSIADFWAEHNGRRITVSYGPKYPVAVIYAPRGRDYVCFEPMTGVTNAFNLAHQGKYSELQTVPAGGKWEESFSIHATGY